RLHAIDMIGCRHVDWRQTRICKPDRGFPGIATVYFWPDRKTVGWVCLLGALVLGVFWFWLEARSALQSVYVRAPWRTTLLLGLGSGMLFALLFSLLAPILFEGSLEAKQHAVAVSDDIINFLYDRQIRE